MANTILVTRSSMPTLDEYVDEIKEMWDSHWLTNMGPKHKELQAKLEELKRRQAEAVEEQNYELAAQLRDQIKALLAADDAPVDKKGDEAEGGI